jgi:hypothetical protein
LIGTITIGTAHQRQRRKEQTIKPVILNLLLLSGQIRREWMLVILCQRKDSSAVNNGVAITSYNVRLAPTSSIPDSVSNVTSYTGFLAGIWGLLNTGIGNITSINREDDLGAITGLAYDITDVNLYGDALNNWQCLTYSWSWKLESGDSWTEAITDADCNKQEWDFNDVSTIRARYTKLEAVGPALGTQIAEYQVIGSSVGQDPPAAGAIVDKMQMLYDPSKGLEVLHNANKGLTITR